MTMLTLANSLQLTVAALAMSGFLAFIFRKRQTTLSVVWMLFCLSISMSMVRHAFDGQLGGLDYVFAIGSGGTCSIFYLVARSLFRSNATIGWPQLLIVSLIILPGIAAPWLELGVERGGPNAATWAAIDHSMTNMQLMFSSTILVLAFWEGIRGWSDSLPTNERRLRMMYLSVYGMCVSVCTIWQAQPESSAFFDQLEVLLQSIAANAIVITSWIAVQYRWTHPLTRPERVAETGNEDQLIARAVERHMRDEQAYLIPDLKVATLAKRLREPDYKISRAITQVLGARNFNQYVNALRIEHAKAMLAGEAGRTRSILTVALDSGFASIGPFNRAFKASEDMTPREFRTAAQAGQLDLGGLGEVPAE